MKHISHLALLLAITSNSSFAQDKVAQSAIVGITTDARGVTSGVTLPVGSTSEMLHPGMNLIGLSLHHTTIGSGKIASLGKDFAELTGLPTDEMGNQKLPLIQGTTYILEITSGDKAGIIQEITQWQNLRLTLSEDIASAGVKAGDDFTIRQAATLNSIFDPRSRVLQKGDNLTTADIVLIPQGSSFGEYRSCFILSLPEGDYWMDARTLEPVGDLPLVYPDGLIVQRKGPSDVTMTFSGEVKPGPTRSVVKPGLNLVATPSSSASSLQDLGLGNDLQKNDDPSAADQVWVAQGPYSFFAKYYIAADGQWIDSSNGEPVTQKILVGSAILIERVGPAALFCLGDEK